MPVSDTLLHCLCESNGRRHVLAVLLADGRLEMRGHGKARTVVGAEQVRCEKCGFGVALDKMPMSVLA